MAVSIDRRCLTLKSLIFKSGRVTAITRTCNSNYADVIHCSKLTGWIPLQSAGADLISIANINHRQLQLRTKTNNWATPIGDKSPTTRKKKPKEGNRRKGCDALRSSVLSICPRCGCGESHSHSQSQSHALCNKLNRAVPPIYCRSVETIELFSCPIDNSGIIPDSVAIQYHSLSFTGAEWRPFSFTILYHVFEIIGAFIISVPPHCFRSAPTFSCWVFQDSLTVRRNGWLFPRHYQRFIVLVCAPTGYLSLKDYFQTV